MISLRITNNEEDIRKWTDLTHEELWDIGFNLDDWDMCVESDTRLIKECGEDEDDWLDPVDDAYWLVRQMENYCVGYHEVEYNGKWYYTVHHS